MIPSVADPPATSLHETPVFIHADDHDVFGVLTAPPGKPNGRAIILLLGGLYQLSIGQNRVGVNTARRLASLGYHVLRLDLHGVGESSGVVEIFDISHPFFSDVLAAVGWLEDRGLKEIVLAGHCYGARTCLAASEHFPRLHGVALFSMPILASNQAQAQLNDQRMSKTSLNRLISRALRLHVLRGLFSHNHRSRYKAIARAKWTAMRGRAEADLRGRVSKDVGRQLEQLARRGTPVLYVYGREPYFRDFSLVRATHIDPILNHPSARIDLRIFDDIKLHGMTSVKAQNIHVAALEEWLAGLDRAIQTGTNGEAS